MMGLIPHPSGRDSSLLIETGLTLIIVRTIPATPHFSDVVPPSGAPIAGLIGGIDVVFTVLLSLLLLRVAFLLGLLGNALGLVVDGDKGIVGYQVVKDGAQLTGLLCEDAGLAIKHLAIAVDAIEVRLDALVA